MSNEENVGVRRQVGQPANREFYGDDGILYHDDTTTR